ncbi:MAG: plasmid pRiA4b ORF-3 family protein, partial [Actinomycetota bacterium]|nr:plasmid pRiA4b ORF-3 family protein [Actinomycetota bacterium]
MRSSVADLVERLRSTRSLPMLRLTDDAVLDSAPPGLPEAGVVESYRWLLARVGGGVRLTQAGYLPPALVAETMQHLGWA